MGGSRRRNEMMKQLIPPSGNFGILDQLHHQPPLFSIKHTLWEEWQLDPFCFAFD
jgi:hypothetical protein